MRERRGGPGGPAGLLQGPARPSCTSCRWGALKGFARAKCATDENIFLGREEAAVRGKAKGAVRPAKLTCTLGPPPHRGLASSRLRALEEVTAASPKEEANGAYSQRSASPGLRAPLPARTAGKAEPHSLPKMANTPPLPRKGWRSQRPNVLRVFRSVPFARCQRDAHSASLQTGGTHWRRRAPKP